MFPAILALSLAFGLQYGVAAQANSSTVVCIAGQCLQGFANLTLGTKLSVPGSATDAILLPGSYSETTNPAFLHQMLTSNNGQLTPSPGFENASSVSLPLNIGLEAGVAFYANSLYSGGAAFSALANSSTGNTTAPTSLPAGSLAISSGVWVAVGTGASNKRVILWDSLPDVSQLPASASGSLALLDIQGASCSPVCAGAGVCTSAGICACPPGFNGTSCETCSPGFFGPHCEACPADCDQCDDGISGSGLCLKPKVTNAPATCNCLNGQCNSDGSCSCNPGWTKSDNGTACAKCAAGFFLGSTGNCQICQLGCTQCVDGTGECLACQTGFTQNPNDKTKCLPPQSTTSTGQICPDGSFGAGSTCTPCSAECQTCSGGTSNDCVVCANGKYKNQQGQCVSADSNGVCAGSNLIADNIKHECDSCPSKCTSCKIPNFSVASTVNQLQCTGCLPGFVLSNGTCVASCPSGTFLGSDNQTCQQCDSSCGSCLGSATFCLSCAAGGLASQGKCVSSCPSGTFSASGACLQCHPDCASCSGSGFNQCSSCPSDRPVLSNGRCLPTCGKGQFFDPSGSGCQACDSSCSSCSSSGPSGCLACSSSNQVLKAGTCVDAKCTSNTTVISGLGVCLSDLVIVPSVTATGSGSAPIPTITGIDAPTVVIQQGKRALEWWEILLMALGCAFIFLVILMCWRRRARRQRAAQTAKFANNKALNPKLSWRQRFLGRFNWFHRKRPAPGPIMLPMTSARSFKGETEEVRLLRIQNAELFRHNAHMEDMDIYGAYEYSRKSTVQPDSPRALSTALSERQRPTSMAESSLYSQFTGEAARAPQPRQPVKTGNLLGIEPLQSRFSLSTHNSSDALPPRGSSPAQLYASRIREDRLTPDATGGSFGSRNPFRQHHDAMTSPHGP